MVNLTRLGIKSVYQTYHPYELSSLITAVYLTVIFAARSRPVDTKSLTIDDPSFTILGDTSRYSSEVEHIIGNDEVESSILSSGTTYRRYSKLSKKQSF